MRDIKVLSLKVSKLKFLFMQQTWTLTPTCMTLAPKLDMLWFLLETKFFNRTLGFESLYHMSYSNLVLHPDSNDAQLFITDQ